MEEHNSLNPHTQYYCSICDTKPDQLSHHKAHLKTQKHIFKRKCFEQCVNMTIFHIHNTKNMEKKEVIQMFEDDTNIKYNLNNEESICKFRYWRISREEFLKNEFPNSIIPDPELNSDSSEFHSNWLKKIIESNETVVLKPKKTNSYIKQIVNTEKYKSFKDKTIEELINNAIDCQTAYDIALVLYKLNYEQFSFKSFCGNVWVDKLDTTILSYVVLKNLRNEISTNLKNSFEEFSKTFPLESEKRKNCSLMIQQLVRTKMKNDIIKEAREMFFNN